MRLRWQSDPPERVGAADAAVDRKQLPVDIGGIVAGEERRCGRDFLSATGTLEWRHVTELALDSSRAGVFEHFAGEFRFDQPGQYCVHAHAGSCEGVGRGLSEIVNGSLARAVGDS